MADFILEADIEANVDDAARTLSDGLTQALVQALQSPEVQAALQALITSIQEGMTEATGSFDEAIKGAASSFDSAAESMGGAFDNVAEKAREAQTQIADETGRKSTEELAALVESIASGFDDLKNSSAETVRVLEEMGRTARAESRSFDQARRDALMAADVQTRAQRGEQQLEMARVRASGVENAQQIRAQGRLAVEQARTQRRAMELAWRSAERAVRAFVRVAGSAIRGLTRVVQGVFRGISRIVATSLRGATRAVQAFVRGVGAALRGIGRAFQLAFRTAQQVVSAALRGMLRAAQLTARGIATALRTAFAGIGSIISGRALTAGLSGIGGILSRAASTGLISGIRAGVMGAMRLFAPLGRALTSTLAAAGRAGMSALRGAFSAAGLIAAAGIGQAVVGGIGRLLALEDAERLMGQILGDTEKVTEAMKILDGVVTGTAFSLDEGAGAMAKMISAGVGLDRIGSVMEAVADAAAFANAPMDEIADIFQVIQSRGGPSARELQRLSQRGIPAFELLASAAGVTVEAMRDMVSSSEIDAATFFELWEEGAKGFGENGIVIAGTAQAMGQTTRGALANMRTALNRLGAAGLAPFFELAAPGFNAIKAAIDSLIPSVTAFADRVRDSATFDRVLNFFEGLNQVDEIRDDLFDLAPGIATMTDAIDAGSTPLDRFRERLSNVRESVGLLSGAIVASGMGQLRRMVPLLGPIVPAINPVLGAMIGLIAASPELRGAIVDMFRGVRDSLGELGDAMAPAIQAFSLLFTDVLLAATPVLQAIIEGMARLTAAVVGLARPFLDLFGSAAVTGMIDAFAGRVAAAIDRVFEAFTGLINFVGRFLDGLTEVFAGRAEIGDLLRTMILTPARHFFTVVLPDVISTAIDTIIGGLRRAFETVFGGLFGGDEAPGVRFLDILEGTFLRPIIRFFRDILPNAIRSAAGFLGPIFAGIGSIVSGAFNLLFGGADESTSARGLRAVDSAGGDSFIERIQSLGVRVLDGLDSTFLGPVTRFIRGPIADGVSAAFGFIADTAIPVIVMAFGRVRDAVGTAVGFLGEAFSPLIAAARGFIDTWRGEGVVAAFRGLWDGLVESARNIWEGVGGDGGLRGVLEGLRDRVLDFLSRFFDEGPLAGIADLGGRLADFFTDVDFTEVAFSVLEGIRTAFRFVAEQLSRPEVVLPIAAIAAGIAAALGAAVAAAILGALEGLAANIPEWGAVVANLLGSALQAGADAFDLGFLDFSGVGDAVRSGLESAFSGISGILLSAALAAVVGPMLLRGLMLAVSTMGMFGFAAGFFTKISTALTTGKAATALKGIGTAVMVGIAGGMAAYSLGRAAGEEGSAGNLLFGILTGVVSGATAGALIAGPFAPIGAAIGAAIGAGVALAGAAFGRAGRDLAQFEQAVDDVRERLRDATAEDQFQEFRRDVVDVLRGIDSADITSLGFNLRTVFEAADREGGIALATFQELLRVITAASDEVDIDSFSILSDFAAEMIAAGDDLASAFGVFSDLSSVIEDATDHVAIDLASFQTWEDFLTAVTNLVALNPELVGMLTSAELLAEFGRGAGVPPNVLASWLEFVSIGESLGLTEEQLLDFLREVGGVGAVFDAAFGDLGDDIAAVGLSFAEAQTQIAALVDELLRTGDLSDVADQVNDILSQGDFTAEQRADALADALERVEKAAQDARDDVAAVFGDITAETTEDVLRGERLGITRAAERIASMVADGLSTSSDEVIEATTDLRNSIVGALQGAIEDGLVTDEASFGQFIANIEQAIENADLPDSIKAMLLAVLAEIEGTEIDWSTVANADDLAAVLTEAAEAGKAALIGGVKEKEPVGILPESLGLKVDVPAFEAEGQAGQEALIRGFTSTDVATSITPESVGLTADAEAFTAFGEGELLANLLAPLQRPAEAVSAGVSVVAAVAAGVLAASRAMSLAGARLAAALAAGMVTMRRVVAAAGASLAQAAVAGARGVSLASIGANIALSMAEGIRGQANTVARAAAATANAAANAARNALQIASPSQVFVGIGRDVGLGFIRGIQDGAQSMKQALTDALTDAVSAATEAAIDAVARSQFGSQLWELLTPSAFPGATATADVALRRTGLLDEIANLASGIRQRSADLLDSLGNRGLFDATTQLQSAGREMVASFTDLRNQWRDAAQARSRGEALTFEQSALLFGGVGAASTDARFATGAANRQTIATALDQVRDWGAVAIQSGRNIQSVINSMNVYIASLQRQAGTQGVSAAAFNNIAHQLGLTNAQLAQWARGLTDLSDATAAGRENLMQFTGQLQAIREFGATLISAGAAGSQVVAQMQAMRDSLLRQATAAGFSAAQINTLVNQVGLSNTSLQAFTRELAEFEAQARRASGAFEEQRRLDEEAAGRIGRPSIEQLHIHTPFGDPEAVAFQVVNRLAYSDLARASG